MSIKLIKPCFDELMERSLPEEIRKDIEEMVIHFNDVHQLHHLCTRKIGNYYAIEFHVRMDGNKSLKETHDITNEIELQLKKHYGDNTHVTIHVEPLKDKLSNK